MNRIAKNAFWIIGCRMIQSLLSLVVSMMSARYLGPSNYGVIQYASSLVTFVVPIMQLGFTTVLVNEIVSSPKREGEILGTAMVSCMGSALLTMVGVVTFSVIANPGETETVIVCALMSLNLLFSAMEMCQYWFQAKLLSKYTSVISLISYVLISAYKIFLLATHKSVYWFAISYALDVMLIAGGLLAVYHRLGGQKLRFSFSLAKSMFAKSKYYILSGLMISVFTQTDRVMLDYMIGPAATGYYSAAVTCATLASFVFGAIIDSGRPVIFESYKSDHALFELNVKRLYSIVIYLSLAQCIVMTLIPEFIIGITYGNDYSPAVSALRIIVWYTTFSYMGIVRNTWLLAESLQGYQWVIDLSGAVSNIVLNILLIPLWGVNGAAVASLISQFIVNVGIGFVIKPVRFGNALMLQALNPRLVLDMVKFVLSRNAKGEIKDGD